MKNKLTADITKRLDNAMKRLNKAYSYINRGGCGVFAKMLGSQLKARGFDVKFVLVLSNTYTVPSAKAAIKDNNIHALNYTDWVHVMVVVDGILMDSEGVYSTLKAMPSYCRGEVKIDLPESILDEWLDEKYSNHWCYLFDRSVAPEIEKKLKRHLVVLK